MTCEVSDTWYVKILTRGGPNVTGPIISSILIDYAPGDTLPAHQPENFL